MADDEYEKLIRRLNPPRVVIDNETCDDATIIQVDSVNKHGMLLIVVQVLTDMNLIIRKAYISSDGGWFMDVFNVIDYHGNKVRDREIVNYIQKTLESDTSCIPPLRESVGLVPSEEHTTIELIGKDRPGLLSEVCAVLSDLNCSVVSAEIWTHNARAAAVVNVTDQSTRRAVKDPKHLVTIKKLLCYVLRGDCEMETAETMLVSSPRSITHRGRRLHQIMFDNRDYQRTEEMEGGRCGGGGGSSSSSSSCSEDGEDAGSSMPEINMFNCADKDYTVITMRVKDRPKLLFDIVCTLTDMQYVVYHGMVSSAKKEAYQEFYIRHVDGLPISSEAERDRVVQCLVAAIERRGSEEGLALELCAEDRAGLLSDVTRVFRENGISIKRAEISTEQGKAKDTFYVTDVEDNPLDQKTIESIKEQVGRAELKVKESSFLSRKTHEETTTGYFLLGGLFKCRTLQSLTRKRYSA